MKALASLSAMVAVWLSLFLRICAAEPFSISLPLQDVTLIAHPVAPVLDTTLPTPRLLFDSTTQPCAQWQFIWPGGTLTAIHLLYAMTSATTGDLTMHIEISQAKSGIQTLPLLCHAVVPMTAGTIGMIHCVLDPAVPLAASIPPSSLMEQRAPVPSLSDFGSLDLCRAGRNARDTATGTFELLHIFLVGNTPGL